jgi:long-chain fatty acid transport protein
MRAVTMIGGRANGCRPTVVPLIAVCLAFCLGEDRALAGALDNSFVGTRAIAMAGAFTGIANDPSAVYFNPAGLAFLESDGTPFEVYGYLSFTKFRYENAGTLFESHEKPLVPGFFAARRFDRFALGFGYYIPYGGGGTAYPDFMGSGIELKSAAGVQAFTAAAAYQITPRFSVGAGVSMFVGVVDTRAPQAIRQPVPAIADYESQYNGRSGYGWNLGVLFKPTQALSVGVSVISPTSVRMDGEERVRIEAFGVDATNDSAIELGTPWYVSAGIAYRLHPGLTLGLSASWMGWSNEDAVIIAHDGSAESTRVLTHYENSYRVSVGMEYAASPKLTLRAGLKYQPGATEDDYLVPTANDVDLVVPSLGVGYRVGKALELDLATFLVMGRRTTHGQESFDQDHVMVVAGLRWGS